MRAVVFVAALMLSSAAAAQQVAVPYETAQLSWLAAPDTPTAPVDEYVIHCGPNVQAVGAHKVTVPGSTLDVALADVVPSPGVYVCAVASQNIAGVGELSPLTPPFVLLPEIELPAPPPAAPVVTAGS